MVTCCCEIGAFVVGLKRWQRPCEASIVSAGQRRVCEWSRRNEWELAECSSASAAGGLMAQSGSDVLVTCRSSIRRR
jgi:hypothetical protein